MGSDLSQNGHRSASWFLHISNHVHTAQAVTYETRPFYSLTHHSTFLPLLTECNRIQANDTPSSTMLTLAKKDHQGTTNPEGLETNSDELEQQTLKSLASTLWRADLFWYTYQKESVPGHLLEVVVSQRQSLYLPMSTQRDLVTGCPFAISVLSIIISINWLNFDNDSLENASW